MSSSYLRWLPIITGSDVIVPCLYDYQYAIGKCRLRILDDDIGDTGSVYPHKRYDPRFAVLVISFGSGH